MLSLAGKAGIFGKVGRGLKCQRNPDHDRLPSVAMSSPSGKIRSVNRGSGIDRLTLASVAATTSYWPAVMTGAPRPSGVVAFSGSA